MVLYTKIKARTFCKTCKSVSWKRKTDQSQNMKHKMTAYFFIVPGHYTRKMAFYASSKPEGHHANRTHSADFSFSDWSTFWNQTIKKLYRIPHRHPQHKTGRVQAPTFKQTITALWCNLDVLMEKIPTPFNYILSLPML